MNAHTDTLATILFIATFATMFLALVVTRVIADARGPVGSSHHCMPGTCPVCDCFGTWER